MLYLCASCMILDMITRLEFFCCILVSFGPLTKFSLGPLTKVDELFKCKG